MGKMISLFLIAAGVINTPAYASDASEDQAFVCRAAISSLMGRPVDIIHASVLSNGLVRTKYTRPDDASILENDCKFDGDKVIWAGVENGQRMRWRTNPNDDAITFTSDGQQVTINLKFGDGSSISEIYNQE